MEKIKIKFNSTQRNRFIDMAAVLKERGELIKQKEWQGFDEMAMLRHIESKLGINCFYYKGLAYELPKEEAEIYMNEYVEWIKDTNYFENSAKERSRFVDKVHTAEKVE
jgi:hypothetical protein